MATDIPKHFVYLVLLAFYITFAPSYAKPFVAISSALGYIRSDGFF